MGAPRDEAKALRGRSIRIEGEGQSQMKMTSRDIPSFLAILVCVLAATALTWWLSMKAIEYVLLARAEGEREVAYEIHC